MKCADVRQISAQAIIKVKCGRIGASGNGRVVPLDRGVEHRRHKRLKSLVGYSLTGPFVWMACARFLTSIQKRGSLWQIDVSRLNLR
jgi:hypothetical protein